MSEYIVDVGKPYKEINEEIQRRPVWAKTYE